ncbi:MAG: hypothetical protein ACJ795_22435, partial [Ktedonobacteraceae bacterium]
TLIPYTNTTQITSTYISYSGFLKLMYDCDEGTLRVPSSQSHMSFKNREPRRRRGESGQERDETQTNKEGLISS